MLFILHPPSARHRLQRYAKYKWAVPLEVPVEPQPLLLMENNAWLLVAQLYPRFQHEKYVGTLSWSAYRKLNLRKLDEFLHSSMIQSGDADYVHFSYTGLSALEETRAFHPGFDRAWTRLCEETGGYIHLMSTHYNYWMCRPQLFLGFVQWMHTKVIPKCIAMPEMYRDALYTVGGLSASTLIKLWGRPYYPIAPFVLERFTFQYFRTHKTLLIPHNVLGRRLVDLLEPLVGYQACEVMEEKNIETIALLVLILYVILHYFKLL
jgi:hypothetical protein